MNKQFNKIKNKKPFIAWIMKNYFDKEKNVNNVWFNFSVKDDDVLEYISDPKNNFPLSPLEIIDMWKTIKGFKEEYKKNYNSFEEVHNAILLKEKNKKEHTLKEIGSELGNVTATLVNRLANTAIEKFKTLTFEKHFEDMTDEELEIYQNAIRSYRNKAADRFIFNLKNSKGNLKTFMELLTKEQIITEKEKKLIKPEEYEVLIELYGLSENDIKHFLFYDIERDDNLLKTYQSMVAYETFPTKKRGRPRKL